MGIDKPKVKILVVSQSKERRGRIRAILGFLGYHKLADAEIDGCGYKKTIDSINMDPPDLIILEGAVHGPNLCRILKKNDNAKKVPKLGLYDIRDGKKYNWRESGVNCYMSYESFCSVISLSPNTENSAGQKIAKLLKEYLEEK